MRSFRWVHIMARPLRIEFSGALYHLTARGNAKQDIFIHDDDRSDFLKLVENVCNRHHWYCHAYCLMLNHYHLLVETLQPTLSRGMKHLSECIFWSELRNGESGC